MHISLDDLNNWERRREGVSEPILQLHRAAASGSPDDIRAVISAGTYVDARDGAEMTPLMSAAYNERLDNIATLLEAGADIRASDLNDCTVLHLCCNNKSVDCTKALVAAGADTEAENYFDHKPLHMACIYGSRELMEYYIGRSESLEETGVLDRTPLMVAAAYGKLHNLEMLIDHEADLDVEDEDGCNLLHVAAENSNSEILRHVLNLNLDLHVNSREDSGKTPLHYAAIGNNLENVKMLLNAGADISARSEDDETPLHSAAFTAGGDVIRQLASESLVDARDSHGQTALHLAACEDNPEAAKALLDAGAEINCRDDEGYTPILDAASLDWIELVKLLFEAGADTSITGDDGLGLISLARESGGDESLKFLKEMGVQDQPAPDGDRITAGSIPKGMDVRAVYDFDDQSLTISMSGNAFSDWAKPFVDRCTPVKFGDLLDKLDVSMEVVEKNWMGLADLMTILGFGLAPHLILTNRSPQISDSVYLYRTTDNHYEDGENKEFTDCIMDLGIGAHILSLGRFNAKEAGAALREFVLSRKNLNESTMFGLQANVDHLRASPPDVGFFDDFLKFYPKKAKTALRSSAVRFAKSLNAGKAKKLAALEPFYEFLELDPKLAQSDLQLGVPESELPSLSEIKAAMAEIFFEAATCGSIPESGSNPTDLSGSERWRQIA